MDEIARDASRRGCRLAQITTYLGNDGRGRAYEKAGFRVLDEKRCTERAKNPRRTRLRPADTRALKLTESFSTRHIVVTKT